MPDHGNRDRENVGCDPYWSGRYTGTDVYGHVYSRTKQNIELCKKFGIKGAPTLVITDGENHQNYYSVPEIKKYLAK